MAEKGLQPDTTEPSDEGRILNIREAMGRLGVSFPADGDESPVPPMLGQPDVKPHGVARVPRSEREAVELLRQGIKNEAPAMPRSVEEIEQGGNIRIGTIMNNETTAPATTPTPSVVETLIVKPVVPSPVTPATTPSPTPAVPSPSGEKIVLNGVEYDAAFVAQVLGQHQNLVADYTRKTQELADVRNGLADEVAKAIAPYVRGNQPATTPTVAPTLQSPNTPPSDVEKRLAEHEERLRAISLTSEFDTLEARYGAFDRKLAQDVMSRTNLTAAGALAVIRGQEQLATAGLRQTTVERGTSASVQPTTTIDVKGKSFAQVSGALTKGGNLSGLNLFKR